MSSLQLNLFKDGSKSFLDALSANDIQFSRRIQLSEGPMASGWIVDVFTTVKDATPWGALALVMLGWLRARASRKVIITTGKNGIIHIEVEGMDIKDVAQILEQAKSAAVFDTKPEIDLETSDGGHVD